MMRNVWIHFFSVLTVISLAGTNAYTNAFFFDIEAGDPNQLRATNLDGVLTGTSINEAICLVSGQVETAHTVTNAGALPYSYDLSLENLTGEACGGLDVQLFQNDVLQFDGLITELVLSDFSLELGQSDTWRVKVKFPFEASGSCTFDTVMSAYQSEFMSGQAYYDLERISHTVSVDSGDACKPHVNLHLSKAISGDPNGFTLSDFSYRVVGNGVDEVVPHDGTIALPTGVYSIEELVPAGFVKADWRIGWYGQCESGDDFSTTITVDDGNIDHGTLYCQADNQYRPELNDSEETAPQSTETQTLEPRRSVGVSRTDHQSREAGGDDSTATSSDGESVPEETDAPETSTTSSEEISGADHSSTTEEEVTSDAEQSSESEPVSETASKEEEAADPGEVESVPDPEPETESEPEPEPEFTPEPEPEPEPEPVPDEAIDQ